MPVWIDILIIACLLLVLAFPYVVYPLLVRYLIRPITRVARPSAPEVPTVSVLIPAHNEAPRLDQKLRNTLALLYPGNRIEILVASDGSADLTAAVARQYEAGGVRVFELEERGGKLAALEYLLSHAQGDLILFTDVGAHLPANLLTELISEFDDPDVAVVMPRYAFVAETETGGAEAAYWSRETRLKSLQAERDMLLGAHGACYLMRRNAIAEVPADTIHDDFLWPLLARAAGAWIVYRADVAVPDVTPNRLSTVFQRTARMAHGNLQLLWRKRFLMHPRHGRVAFSLFGHKLLKTLGPLWILGLAIWVNARAITGSALTPLAVAGDTVLGLLLASLAWRRLGLPLPRSLERGAYALVAQSACGVGILRFLVGIDGTRWRRPPENQALALHRPARPPRSVRIAKRSVDIIGSSLAILVSLPLIPLVALAIRLNSPGPVLYRQERVAKDDAGNGYQFLLYKFRTMRLDAEADGGAVWAKEDDPRVTAVGAFLRKARLDELPQLFQVLRGEMTLIGPRPERPSICDILLPRLPGYDDRLATCKPGITGWAQVHTGYDTSVESVREKLFYDLAYNAHLYGLRSYFAMEARIIFLTLAVMVYGRGAR